MKSLHVQPVVQPSPGPPLVRFEPVRFHHTMFDGRWWPRSGDPAVELRALVPLLDRINGPVTRLLLSAVGWATRPHDIVVGDRTVSLGYFSDQPPAMLTAICANGGTVALLVTSGRPPGQGRPASAAVVDGPGSPDGEDRWESEGGKPAAHRESLLR
jgi:hypothetical protein